jgi:hypothetical protein
MEEPVENQALDNMHSPALAPAPLPEFATRAKQRAKQQIQQNRFVIIAGGSIVTGGHGCRTAGDIRSHTAD